MAANLNTQPDAERVDRPVLELCDVSKSFGAVRALRGVSLRLHAGEVLGLVGDNGAGKSTLVKCISGVHQPDSGQILVDGEPRVLTTPHVARDLGIETVYQDLSLIDAFDVTANFFLGRERHHGPSFLRLLDKRRMTRETQAILGDRLNVKLPSLNVPTEYLSGGQRQAIAIARAVAWGRHIVLLDEPAAALGVEQSELVLNLIASLSEQGISVIVISHNMQHVLRSTHRVMVLRQGSKVGEVRRDETTEHDLVTMIMGGNATEDSI